MKKSDRDAELLWWFVLLIAIRHKYSEEDIREAWLSLSPRRAKVLGPRLGLGGPEAIECCAGVSCHLIRSTQNRAINDLVRLLQQRDEGGSSLSEIRELVSRTLNKINQVDPKAIRSLIRHL